MSKNQKDIFETVGKEYPDFVEAVSALTTEEINARLAQSAKDVEALADSQEADEALEKAKELVSELSSPYRDTRKAIRLKSRYLIALLKERGAK